MIDACLYLWDPDNLEPWTPFGRAGIIKASTTAFFAFWGFEEASNLSGRITFATESCYHAYTLMCLTRGGAKLIPIIPVLSNQKGMHESITCTI